MPGDFYELLGIDADAPQEDVKRAFRERAREYHPDVNDNPRAQQQFKTLNEAYEIISNPKERARYDRLGHRDYVDQHLEGLPTMGTPGKADDGTTAPESDDRGSASTAVSESSSRSSESGSRSSETPSQSGSTGAGSTDSTATASTKTGSTSTATTGERSSGSSATSTTSATSSTRTNATGGTSTRTNATGGTSTASTSRSRTRRTTTETETGRGAGSGGSHRAGLRRGWFATIIALGLYIVGLAVYLTIGGGLDAVDRVRADPVAALLASTPLADPLALVLDAGSSLAAGGPPDPIVTFAVGTVALPLAVGITVGRYGRGSAYLYPVAMGLPLAYVVVRTVGSLPLAADVLSLVIIPIGAALAFSIDTGRYLFAS